MLFRFMLLLFPILLCSLWFSACNKKQKDAAQKSDTATLTATDVAKIDFYNYDYILVGSYGGFTGGKRMYRFDANGTLQAIQSLKAGAPADTLKARKLVKSKNKELRKAVKESKIAETQLDDPGNMTYFITLGKGNAEHTLRWGNKKDALPENIRKLHNLLLGHCNLQ